MKRILKLFILLLIPISLAGQLSPVTSQYVLNPLSINPAYAGNRGALNIAAFYRRQWAGITGAPETITLAADSPFLDSKLGLGLIITSDKIGVTKETHFLTNYSYKISMNKGILSFGLGAGLLTTNTKWSDLVVLDPGDENFLTDSRVFVVPDFSFGVYYSYQNYFGGLSIPKLLGYRFNYDKNKYTLMFNPGQYNYLLNAGYIYTLSQKIKLFPSTLITFSPKEKLLVDLNAYVSLNDRIWAGASYRNRRSIGVLFQFAVNNQFRVAYTYDIDFGKLGRYSNGSHEIMLRYEFHYKVDAISPLNF
ncbi:MAG TPA: type IX secretion system membrane protein PorP/SprF [Bacteroidales bacterium]